MVPDDGITVKVESGWVTLSGETTWHYQSEEAERAAAKVSGVRGVSNAIKLAKRVHTSDVRSAIRAAFTRQANLDANSVDVAVDGSKVTLSGHVGAWHERTAAERAAWAAPGVTQVVDRFAVY